METKKIIHDISLQAMIKIAIFIAVIALIIHLRNVLISLFVALILMSTIAPLVAMFKEKAKFPTIWAITTAYLIAVGITSFLFYLVIPPLVNEVASFMNALPYYMQQVLNIVGVTEAIEQENLYKNNLIPFFSEKAGQFAQGALGITVQLFSGIIDIITIAVFTFYLLLDRESPNGGFLRTLPFLNPKAKEKTAVMIDAIQLRLGQWARGQLILCVIIGVCTFIGLSVLNIPYALPLAVIAGILEMVPTLGPIISAIPAIIVVLAVNPAQVFLVLALYLIIQQAENSLIVPKVMEKAVGFPPLLTIIAIMIGGRLLGIWGALLAVPITVTAFQIIQHFKNVEELNVFEKMQNDVTQS